MNRQIMIKQSYNIILFSLLERNYIERIPSWGLR